MDDPLRAVREQLAERYSQADDAPPQPGLFA